MDEEDHTCLDRKQLSKNRTSFILRSIKTDTGSQPNPPWLGGTDTDEDEDDDEGAQTLADMIPGSPAPPASMECYHRLTTTETDPTTSPTSLNDV